MFKRKPRIDENIYGRLMTSFGRVVDQDPFVAGPAAALAARVIEENGSLVASLDERMYQGAGLYHLRLLAGAWIVSNEGGVPRATAEVFEEAIAWKFGLLAKASAGLARKTSELARGEFVRRV